MQIIDWNRLDATLVLGRHSFWIGQTSKCLDAFFEVPVPLQSVKLGWKPCTDGSCLKILAVPVPDLNRPEKI